MKSSDLRIYRFLTSLETLSRGGLIIIALGVVFLIGTLDYLTGFELSISLFYLIPVALIAWTVDRNTGMRFSVFGAIVWLISNTLSGQSFTNIFIGVWNTLIRFGFFAVVTILLAELRKALEEERMLANTDPLTGVMNRRSFNEVAEKRMIVSEVNRKPYTLAYIDLDDFKGINGRYGQAAGDMLLKTVADVLHKQIRQGDLLARLGEDEFAVLLNNTGEETARTIIQRLLGNLHEKMKFHEWEVTFSIGVLTFLTMPVSADQMVSLTEELMYEAKTDGRGAVRFSAYT